MCNVTAKSGAIVEEKNISLYGKTYITDYLGNLRFDISANSFFQVNSQQTLVLYDKVAEFSDLTGSELVVDAYCGTGSISLKLASMAKEVIGIEAVSQAVEDAKKNAEHNNIANVKFYAGRVEKVISSLSVDRVPDVVVLDPPRRGCEKEVIDSLIQMSIPKIVYVSCNPSTLARDLFYLSEGGYEILKVQPVDMFCHTGHCEVVVSLKKKH